MRVLSAEDRKLALIVYPARAMTGLRHVVVPSVFNDNTLCGIDASNWYGEFKRFDPTSIGCKRCKKVWARTK